MRLTQACLIKCNVTFSCVPHLQFWSKILGSIWTNVLGPPLSPFDIESRKKYCPQLSQSPNFERERGLRSGTSTLHFAPNWVCLKHWAIMLYYWRECARFTQYAPLIFKIIRYFILEISVSQGGFLLFLLHFKAHKMQQSFWVVNDREKVFKSWVQSIEI